jgi:hypothetical protein
MTNSVPDGTDNQPDAWGRDPSDKTPHRVDLLRRHVGSCPACRMGIYAEVAIRTEIHAPTIAEGAARASASARPIGATVTHECTGIRRDGAAFTDIMAAFFGRPGGSA